MTGKVYISFIIALYNRQEWIEHTLNSIINGGYADYEIIVVDDASRDQSLSVVKRYAQRFNNIKIIENKINRGVGFSKNVGLANASGDWVFFADSDDEINTAEIAPAAKQLKDNENADLVYMNYIVRDSAGNETRVKNVDQAEKMTAEQFLFQLREFNGYMWRFFFKREFLSRFDLKVIDLKYAEDTLFLGKAFIYAREVLCLPVYFYKYYKHISDNSITKNIDVHEEISTFYQCLKELGDYSEKAKTQAIIKFYKKMLITMMFPNIIFSDDDILPEMTDLNNKNLKTKKEIFHILKNSKGGGEIEALNYIRKTVYKILKGIKEVYLYPYGEATQAFLKVAGQSIQIKGIIDNKKKGTVSFRQKVIKIISFAEFLGLNRAEKAIIFILSNKDKELKKVIDEQLQVMDKSLNDLKIEIYTLSDFLDDIVAWI